MSISWIAPALAGKVMGAITINPDGSGVFDDRTKVLVTNGNVILAIDQNSTFIERQPLLYIYLAAMPTTN